MEEDVDRADRWSQDAEGTITLFLNGACIGGAASAAPRTSTGLVGSGRAVAASSAGAMRASFDDGATVSA